jgi:BirA family transcriptional regulator, biotin operon repressor / biotin---[acetyl-CoA-carboxylase] ligase
MTQTIINIVELLKKYDWISGENIASHLHISRTAVWKHIQQLKKKGYHITAKPNQGYHLLKTPDTITTEEIKQVIKTKHFASSIHHLPSVSSTNDYAKTLAKKGEPEGSLIIADKQTGGRGRKQRKWISPEKGLWFSLILRPKITPNDAMLTTMCAACAVTKGISEQTPLKPSIKWPNDILINNKKVCGILTELSAEIDEITYLIIGIGINVNNEIPSELKEKSTTLKQESNKPIDSVLLLSSILSSFEHFYQKLTNKDILTIKDTWRSYSSTIGAKVTVKKEKEVITGIAVDLGEHGELIIKNNQGEKKILTGDISYL